MGGNVSGYKSSITIFFAFFFPNERTAESAGVNDDAVMRQLGPRGTGWASDASDRFIARTKRRSLPRSASGKQAACLPTGRGAYRPRSSSRFTADTTPDARNPSRCPDNPSGHRVLHVPGVGFVVINSLATRRLCAHSPTRPHTSNPRVHSRAGASGKLVLRAGLRKGDNCRRRSRPFVSFDRERPCPRRPGKWTKFRN